MTCPTPLGPGPELGGCFYGARAHLFAVTAHARDSLARLARSNQLYGYAAAADRKGARDVGLLGQARVGSTSHILGEQRKKYALSAEPIDNEPFRK